MTKLVHPGVVAMSATLAKKENTRRPHVSVFSVMPHSLCRCVLHTEECCERPHCSRHGLWLHRPGLLHRSSLVRCQLSHGVVGVQSLLHLVRDGAKHGSLRKAFHCGLHQSSNCNPLLFLAFLIIFHELVKRGAYYWKAAHFAAHCLVQANVRLCGTGPFGLTLEACYHQRFLLI